MRWFRKRLYWVADAILIVGEGIRDYALRDFIAMKDNAWRFESEAYNKEALKSIADEAFSIWYGPSYYELLNVQRGIGEAEEFRKKKQQEPKTA